MSDAQPKADNSAIVLLARHAGPAGVTAVQMAHATGRPIRHVQVALPTLASRGKLVRLAPGHYVHPMHAPAVAAPDGPTLHDVRSPMRTASTAKPGRMDRLITAGPSNAGRAAAVPAPVTITGSLAPSGTAVVPVDVAPVRGHAAGHDPRYQCAPGERPYGAGFAAAGIGRDLRTGKAWAAAGKGAAA